MAVEWIVGTLQDTPIEWMHIETVIPVAVKELVSIKFKAKTTDVAGGYIYFDNFGLFRNLTNDKTLGNNVVYLPLEAGTTELPVFGALVDCHIAKAHLVPKADIIGSDTNPMQLLLRNMGTNEIICTKTFALNINASAYDVTAFGPASDTHRELLPGDGVRFEQSGSGTIPEMLLVIEWNLS